MAEKRNAIAKQTGPKAPPLGAAGSGKGMPEIERTIQDLGEFTLTPAQAARAEKAIDEAAAEQEARVSFRWRSDSLAVVKKAAARVGVPYQTYMKVVLYEKALSDLADVD